MSTVDIRPLNTISKGPGESRVIEWDWDEENLATDVTISLSTWTITVLRPSSELVAGLTKDNESILAGTRKTQVRVIGGTLGSEYLVTNTITTNETPAQIKVRSVVYAIVTQ